MPNPFRALRSAAFLFCLSGASLFAQTVDQTASPIAKLRPVPQVSRISASADLGPQVALVGHIPSWVNPVAQVNKAVDLSQTMRVQVILSRDASVQAAFTKFLDDQQTPGSPVFHQWLTAEQVGTLFGPTDSDLAAVTSWLSGQGLKVDSISPAHNILEVSGSTSAISSAFRTSFGYFTLDGAARLSAVSDPSIPQALSPVIKAIHGLTEVPMYPQHVLGTPVPAPGSNKPAANATTVSPNLTSGSGNHFLSANDFSKIYDIDSVFTGGNRGATIGSTSQHIAIVARSRVSATDISEFVTNMALPATNLNTIIPTTGADPGPVCTQANASTCATGGDQGEATLDVNRVISVANSAQADLVASATFGGTDGVYISAAYNVNTLKDPIMTISFGSCEVRNGASGVAVWDTLFSTAAAEGISVFVSSGDSGAAACAPSFSPITTTYAGYGASINVICSTTYVTCVGGTEFADTASPSTYWSGSNSTGGLSVLSYIPEGGWNEPTSCNTGSFCPSGTGGGPSSFITKPTYQTAATPADGHRDTPDISFSASIHDGYYSCLDFQAGAFTCPAGYLTYFGGTSAAAPGMAGIAALINTKLGAAQGNMNPLLYKTFGTTPAAFHDVTVASSGVSGCVITTPSMCNNSTPSASANSTTGTPSGQQGYLVGAGYDLVTGLGSLDVAAFLAAAATPTVSTTTSLTATPNPTTINQNITLSATVTPSSTTLGATTGTVKFYYTPSGGSQTLISTATLPGTAPYTVTGTISFPATGTYALSAVYSGDNNYITSTATTVNEVINNAPSFSAAAAPSSLSLVAGGTGTSTVTFTSLNAFVGAVVPTCALTTTTGTIGGATCTVLPTPVTLASGGTGTTTLSVITTASTVGAITATVTGTSGTLTASTTVAVTVVQPSFTVVPATTSLAVTSSTGATTPADNVVLTSTNSFAGTVALTCTVTTATGNAAGTCAVAPTSLTLTAGGTGTTVLTVSPTAGTAGTLTVTVKGTSGTLAVTSAAITVTVTSPSFSFSTPAAITITSGATTGNTTTSNITSTNGYTGAVTVTCSASVSSAAFQPTCTATSTTATPGVTTITIGSTTAQAARGTAQAGLALGLKSGLALASLLCLIGFRRRRSIRTLAAFALLAISLASVAGCGDGGNVGTAKKSSAGTYTVTVTGSGSTNGTASAPASTTFTLTIN